jgi:exosortase A-associated hydrolase 1/exosortase A-associated hydrolase 2
MVSQQARQLADQGYYVVVPDLFGTGDSSGEFGQADWQRWQRDTASVIQWVVGQGGQGICLWGLRLGCLLALDVARAHTEDVRNLILWQPVLTGKAFMTQFLRLRMAANLGERSDNTPTAMRAESARGANIEVAGYWLSPELVRAIDSIDAAALVPPPGVDTCWLELSVQEGASLAVGSRKVLDSWIAAGAQADYQVVSAEAFWSTQEVAMAPALLAATTRVLSVMSDAGGKNALDSFSMHQQDQQYNGEQLVSFDCHGDELIGVLHKGAQQASTAVLIVVGGPQYRVGSHRQFVSISRQLAEAGVPVLRFDYRGMGDSEGHFVGFQGIGDDIACAVDVLQESVPTIEKIVLLGLCDAATASAFYAPSDQRIAGLVLINPWVRSERGEARTYLRHYYLSRLLDPGLWKKVAGGKFRLSGSLRSLWSNLRSAMKPAAANKGPGEKVEVVSEGGDLVRQLYRALDDFPGQVLLVLSGNDLTAAEFEDASNADAGLGALLAEQRVEWHRLPEADHTFSRQVWRDELAQRVLEWLKAL